MRTKVVVVFSVSKSPAKQKHSVHNLDIDNFFRFYMKEKVASNKNKKRFNVYDGFKNIYVLADAGNSLIHINMQYEEY